MINILIIIALEVLAITIRNDDTIFLIQRRNVKLNSFADDVTCILKNKGFYISILEDFGECSGLKVNHEKTEVFVFGESSLWEDL